MQIEWVRFDRERYNPNAFAAVRQGAREGTLLDVATDPIFIGLLLRSSREQPDGEREQSAARIQADQPFSETGAQHRERASVDTASNRTAPRWSTIDVLHQDPSQDSKAGINPEIEIGRFLTEVAGFANTPALLGTRRAGRGRAAAARSASPRAVSKIRATAGP